MTKTKTMTDETSSNAHLNHSSHDSWTSADFGFNLFEYVWCFNHRLQVEFLKVFGIFWYFLVHVCNSFPLTPGPIRGPSGAHPGPIRGPSGAHPGPIRGPSGAHPGPIRGPSGAHPGPIRGPSGAHPGPIRGPSGAHPGPPRRRAPQGWARLGGRGPRRARPRDRWPPRGCRAAPRNPPWKATNQALPWRIGGSVRI